MAGVSSSRFGGSSLRRDALTEAMRQTERYGEDPADFAGQPRGSFRVDPEHVHEYH